LPEKKHTAVELKQNILLHILIPLERADCLLKHASSAARKTINENKE